MRAVRKTVQTEGAERENNWHERGPFVVRVGCGVSCACLLGGGARQWRRGVCAPAPSPGSHVGTRGQNWAVGGAKERG